MYSHLESFIDTLPLTPEQEASRARAATQVSVWPLMLDVAHGTKAVSDLYEALVTRSVTNLDKLVDEAHSWGFIDEATKREWAKLI